MGGLGFFSPWKDTKQTQWLGGVLTFSFTMLLMGIYVNFQDDPASQTRALIFLLMLIWASMFGITDWLRKSQTGLANIEFVYFGSINRLLIGGFFGVLLAILISGALFISSPLAIPTIGGASLTFFYVVLVAPYSEEKFFSSTVAPTAYKLFGGYAGLIITSGFFGFYHGFAYGWETNAMMTAALWRAVVLIGNQILQTTGFGLGAHVANNYIVHIASGGGW